MNVMLNVRLLLCKLMVVISDCDLMRPCRLCWTSFNAAFPITDGECVGVVVGIEVFCECCGMQ